MRILISNDDGVHAPGIRALAMAMSLQGEVFVVAPDRQRSASSHGISLYDALYVENVDLGAANVHAMSVSGTPVDCVKWAISQIGTQTPFDFMLSGINEGQNLATDVLYSGTVAAAGEAALQGIPAMALSQAGPPYSFDSVAAVANQLFCLLKDKDFGPDTFLNVNFPPNDLSDVEWKSTRLGARGFTDRFFHRKDTSGKTYYKYAGEELAEVGGEDTDVLTVKKGNISVTPLRYRFTNDGMIDTLASWLSADAVTSRS